MKTLLAFLLAAGTALSASTPLGASQDDLDGAIRGLAEKLSKDGLTGRLADAIAGDAGVQAIHEKIDFLLAARISRFERDAVGHLEDYLFTVDASGDLHLKPERKPEIDALVRRLPFAARAMSGFSRRADDLVRRLGANEMDQKAKTTWSDPNFRTAFFHRHPAELRELEDSELIDAAGFRGRAGGVWAAESQANLAKVTEQLEAIKIYERSFLKLVTQVTDASARGVLSGEAAMTFLVGRVIRQVNEGAPAPIGGLTEGNEEQKIEPGVTFTGPLADLVPLVKDVEALLKALEKDLAFVPDARARALVVERILHLKEEQKRKAEEIMSATLEDGFTADGDKLSVKKGRYVDGEGKDSPDVLAAELEGIIAEFVGTSRQDFDRIAERCLDPGVIALFEDRPGTYLLAEFRDQVIEGIAQGIRTGGLDAFIKTYLVKQGDLYVVRPERASRVEAILKRAADITAGK
jgi:hypothetical protein